MKTIPVEQLDKRLSKAIEQQDEHEAIGLTNDSGTVAWVLRVPKSMKDTEADSVLYSQGPTGPVFVLVQARHADGKLVESAANGAHIPVFGAGRGSLTILSDDEEHLKDFQEYME
jgi:hypothetical protein